MQLHVLLGDNLVLDGIVFRHARVCTGEVGDGIQLREQLFAFVVSQFYFDLAVGALLLSKLSEALGGLFSFRTNGRRFFTAVLSLYQPGILQVQAWREAVGPERP